MQTGAAPPPSDLATICPNTGQTYLIYNEENENTKLELNSNPNKRAVTKMQDQSIGQNYVNSLWRGWKDTCDRLAGYFLYQNVCQVFEDVSVSAVSVPSELCPVRREESSGADCLDCVTSCHCAV